MTNRQLLLHCSFLTRVVCLLLLLSAIEITQAQPLNGDQLNGDHPGRRLMQQGLYQLQEADDLELAARQQLQDSNRLRQQLLQLRRQASQAGQSNNQVNVLTQQMSTSQQQGSLLRQQANSRREDARSQFSKGMQALWPQWTSSNFFSAVPYINSTEQLPVSAHNTLERSVHPGMQETLPTPTTHQESGMSLAINNTAQQNQPDNVDRSIYQLSRDRLFVGHISAVPLSNHSVENEIPINTIHNWYLIVSDLQGNPIQNAEIQFSGHMPGHVHGLPTQPQVDKEVSAGVYDVSGVKFQMRGWWVIDFTVNVGQQNDVLRFNLVL